MLYVEKRIAVVNITLIKDNHKKLPEINTKFPKLNVIFKNVDY